MTAALLVIDAQESFRVRGEWADIADPDVCERIGELVDEARRHDVTVYWLLHSEPGTGGVFDPEIGHVRLIDGFVPRDSEPVIVKTTINAFTSTDLEAGLRAGGVERVVICGIRTEQCCETSARLAADLGFEVVFVAEATTTTGLPGVTADQIKARTAAVLTGRGFAAVATVAELAKGGFGSGATS